MGEEREKALARERALVILQVRSGALSAREGARRLGISRKTYYEWEQRALGAMTLALESRPPGRLPVPMDEEKESLRRQVKELEKKLFLTQKVMEVRELRWAYESLRKEDAKKNRQAGGKVGKRR
jgi:transposase